MFQISALAENKYFHVRLQYVFIKKYRTFININSTHFRAYTHRGLENIGQIWICPMITVVFFHHVGSFVLLFISIIYNNKSTEVLYHPPP